MKSDSQRPLIVAFVSDLMFSTKINNVVQHLGYRVRWIERASEFAGEQERAQEEPLGEKLYGQEGQLFERITDWQPSLLLFDLNNEAVPWQDWIPYLKTSAATRRIPVIAFGSHVNVEALQGAEKLGADFVYPRSRFAAAMPQLLQEHVRVPQFEAIQSACQEPLSELAVLGIEKFNEGAYYACHDDLEEAWRQDDGPGRDLYRGILQVAIAYYQVERGNYRGATKMLLRMRQWLDPLPFVCRGVEVKTLLEDAAIVQNELTSLGPDRIAEFDVDLFKPVRYQLP
jgi:hypothetical protein